MGYNPYKMKVLGSWWQLVTVSPGIFVRIGTSRVRSSHPAPKGYCYCAVKALCPAALGWDFQPTLRGRAKGQPLTLPYLDVPGWKLGSMVRINGLFDLLVNGICWGYNPLILSIYQLPGTSKYLYVWLGRGCVAVLFLGCIFFFAKVSWNWVFLLKHLTLAVRLFENY